MDCLEEFHCKTDDTEKQDNTDSNIEEVPCGDTEDWEGGREGGREVGREGGRKGGEEEKEGGREGGKEAAEVITDVRHTRLVSPESHSTSTMSLCSSVSVGSLPLLPLLFPNVPSNTALPGAARREGGEGGGGERRRKRGRVEERERVVHIERINSCEEAHRSLSLGWGQGGQRM